MENENNPFVELSQIFIDNQRTFNSKCKELADRTGSLASKLHEAKERLIQNPFDTNLNAYLNIEEESRVILSVAKEVEFHRDKIIKTVELLKASNEIKLNKN